MCVVPLMRSMGFFLDSLTFEQYSDVIHDIGGKLFKVIDKSDGVQRFLNRPSIELPRGNIRLQSGEESRLTPFVVQSKKFCVFREDSVFCN